jgi:hypothetical protein
VLQHAEVDACVLEDLVDGGPVVIVLEQRAALGGHRHGRLGHGLLPDLFWGPVGVDDLHLDLVLVREIDGEHLLFLRLHLLLGTEVG